MLPVRSSLYFAEVKQITAPCNRIFTLMASVGMEQNRTLLRLNAKIALSMFGKSDVGIVVAAEVNSMQEEHKGGFFAVLILSC